MSFTYSGDHALTAFHVGRMFRVTFDFSDGRVLDCAGLYEMPDGIVDEVETLRSKGEAPSQYGNAGDWTDETEDDETEGEETDGEAPNGQSGH